MMKGVAQGRQQEELGSEAWAGRFWRPVEEEGPGLTFKCH